LKIIEEEKENDCRIILETTKIRQKTLKGDIDSAKI